MFNLSSGNTGLGENILRTFWECGFFYYNYFYCYFTWRHGCYKENNMKHQVNYELSRGEIWLKTTSESKYHWSQNFIGVN